jgi:hypothetical protein
MGRKTKPIEFDPAHVERFLEVYGGRMATWELFKILQAVNETGLSGEFSGPVAALHSLRYLMKNSAREDFDWKGFHRYAELHGEPVICLPASMVFALARAWDGYIEKPEADMEDAFGVATGTGRRNARNTILRLEQSFRLAAMINQERIKAMFPSSESKSTPQTLSLEKARTKVRRRLDAEGKPVSEAALKRAWLRWKDFFERFNTLELGR